MRIWIDITNSPHVLFFEPIIRDLSGGEHEVFVTARDYAQTVPLLEQKSIDYRLIGRHRGAASASKALGLASRSSRLFAFGARKHFDIAFSHNSNDLSVAAAALGVPHLIVHDYEHANLSYAVNARLATRILVPNAIPTEAIVAHGAKRERIGHFPGLKEHVYLQPDSPTVDLRESLGAGPGITLAVVRPPATMSAYHRFENELFDEIIGYIGTRDDVIAIVLPRTAEQAAQLGPKLPSNASVPTHILDGPSLIRSADLVISAGGTMNREAAVLGTPAYTIFAGEQGAVDEDLIARGLLSRVEEPEEVAFVPKQPGAGWRVENRDLIIDEMFAIARQGKKR
jgi:predicted glycosyltransferase